MGYINIFVQNDANISIKQSQLVLVGNKVIDYPLEDINAIVIENLRTKISTYTLNKLTEYKICLYLCDEKHMPSSILLPYNRFFYPLDIYEKQVNMALPLKKQIWKSVIKNKIENQCAVLDKFKIKNELADYLDKVQSGDKTNVEAIVANIYFKKLFGKNFTRNIENNINAMLNYGYAIIRGAIARSVCVHGLVPFLGIFHKNKLNGFNLVDDLIEPFRPLIDEFVYQNRNFSFETSIKLELFNLLNFECSINNKRFSISQAIEELVESYVKCIKQQKPELISIKFKTLKVHEYE